MKRGRKKSWEKAENTIFVVGLTRATLALTSKQEDRLRLEGTPEIIW